MLVALAGLFLQGKAEDTVLGSDSQQPYRLLAAGLSIHCSRPCADRVLAGCQEMNVYDWSEFCTRMHNVACCEQTPSDLAAGLLGCYLPVNQPVEALGELYVTDC